MSIENKNGIESDAGGVQIENKDVDQHTSEPSNSQSAEGIADQGNFQETPNAQANESIEDVTQSFEGTSREEDLDKPIDFEGMIGDLDKSINSIETKISELTLEVNKKKAELDEVRKALGLDVGGGEETKIPEEELLEELKMQEEELRNKREEAEMTGELNEVLMMLGKLPAEELEIIIQTGKGSNGREIETKHGRIKPDVAKRLAEAAKNGAKFITKAILGIAIGIVSGIIAGVFDVAKDTATK